MDKLSAHQKSTLRMLLEDFDPGKVKWSDVLRSDGYGRNPTFHKLTRLGLIEYKQFAGNSFNARLTIKGILYLHGEREE